MVVAKLLFHQPQDGMIPLSSAIAQDLGDQFSRRIKGENVDRHSLGHTSSQVAKGKKRKSDKNHYTSIGLPSRNLPPSAVPQT